MKDFKTQFQYGLIKAGSIRKNEGYGKKHYVAGFVQGRHVIHESKIQHKTASAAIQYAQAVRERYGRMVMAALSAFVESQNVQPAI